MDFVHDALANGRPFRVLTVVDQWSRQSPILEVATSMSGSTVGVALDNGIADGIADGIAPRSITVDHGTEFMSRALEDLRGFGNIENVRVHACDVRISEYSALAARQSASGTPSSLRTMLVPTTSETIL